MKTLKKLLENQNYIEPTVSLLRRLHNEINREIFNNELEKPDIIVRRLHMAWGYQQVDQIHMNHWFPSGWLLAQVFAHEMAHQAQVDLLDDENGPIHGKSFFTWEKEFAMIGITLKKRYD